MTSGGYEIKPDSSGTSPRITSLVAGRDDNYICLPRTDGFPSPVTYVPLFRCAADRLAFHVEREQLFGVVEQDIVFHVVADALVLAELYGRVDIR